MKLRYAVLPTIKWYCLAVWAYCAVRIFTGGFDWSERFIWNVPVTFWELAIVAFVASAVADVLWRWKH